MNSDTLWESGSCSDSSLRELLEAALPRVIDVVPVEEYLIDASHWNGLYNIPNCPTTLDTTTATNAYTLAIKRSGFKASLKLTPALTKQLNEFFGAFKAAGGVSLYHWAFVFVSSYKKSSDFTSRIKTNSGPFFVFDKKHLTPWRLSQMFRCFPSGPVLCTKPCDSVVLYQKRQQAELINAARIAASSQVEAGIQYLREQFTTVELKNLANEWRRTAKLVEQSLNSRIAAGEDVWLGLLPGLER